jgi:hypothetical protein
MIEIKDAKQFEYLWRNSGQLETGDTISLTDALSVSNAPVLMPKVISNIVKEAIEPMLIGTSLLQRINYSYGHAITFPAVGALTAGDIAEGQEYPESSTAMGGATVTAQVGKSGLAVRITEEMVRYSQFDVIGMHLRRAGYALARHKEVKIFNMIRSMGVPVFDNVNSTRSIKGVMTGRDLTGSPNGSITMDDIFDGYAQVITQGFFPNTLLMHPLAWVMFLKDAQLRYFAQMSGGGAWFGPSTGNPAPNASSWASSSQGGLGTATGQLVTPAGNAAGLAATPLSGLNANTLTSAPVLPSYMNIPFRIIVSPFVAYDHRRKLTDIYMFDSRELGVLIVDEDVTVDQFNDPRVDIMKIKLRERYALAILNEGQAIASFRNVHLVTNEVILPAQSTIDISGSISAISPTASVLG